ncbi:MAG TPA: hypothetical protein VJ911_02570 [Cryomorphaceae bacterium]|nr:hypothetical protein [Cryomorphaceae bacterium]
MMLVLSSIEENANFGRRSRMEGAGLINSYPNCSNPNPFLPMFETVQ